MKAKLKINKNSVFLFLFVTLFLDEYSFFSIGTRYITLWYLGAFFLIMIALVKPQDIFREIKNNPFALIMLIYMPLNYIITGSTQIAALIIGMLCWFFYICCYRKSDVNNFLKIVDFYQSGMRIMAIYGIYQVIGSYFGLPFIDLRLEGFHVEGYNWSNPISIGGIVLRRANAIFREPSFFSQFLAISILIYFQSLICGVEKKARFRSIKWICISMLALILSFSGTGLIMVILGGIILLSTNNVSKTLAFIKRNAVFVIVEIMMIIVLIFVENPISTYLVGRLTEMNGNNLGASAYLRFVQPFTLSMAVMKNSNLYIGLGIGNAFEYTRIVGTYVYGIIASIVPRTITEEGIIGFSILVFFYIRMISKHNCYLSEYKALLVGTFLMSFMHGTWSSEVYWLLLGFLNVNLLEINI